MQERFLNSHICSKKNNPNFSIQDGYIYKRYQRYRLWKINICIFFIKFILNFKIKLGAFQKMIFSLLYETDGRKILNDNSPFY